MNQTEIVISYTLLITVVILEIYSVLFLLLSDWGLLWLSKQRKPWAKSVYLVIRSSRLLSCLNNDKRWKRCMAQHELANARFARKGYGFIDCYRMAKHFLRKLQGSGKIQSWVDLDDCLKNLIFNQLLDKRSRCGLKVSKTDLEKILSQRGQHVLEKEGCLQDFRGAILDTDFLTSLVRLHIATDICYHDDRYRGRLGYVHPNCRMSRILSNYMIHLFGDCPAILPKGIDTREMYEMNIIAISEFCWSWRSETDPMNRWDSDRFRGQLDDEYLVNETELPQSIELARSLQSLVLRRGWESECKWKMMSEVWVEMLGYAGIHGGWKEHANALARGGELITHLRLLMAHLGFSEESLSTFSRYGVR